jgi:hypothetical protein
MADISLFNRSLAALRLLGVTDGDLRDRFQAAYQQWLPIEPGDLREQDARKLEALLDELQQVENPDPEVVASAIQRMDDARLKRAADELAGLCEGAIVSNRSW